MHHDAQEVLKCLRPLLADVAQLERDERKTRRVHVVLVCSVLRARVEHQNGGRVTHIRVRGRRANDERGPDRRRRLLEVHGEQAPRAWCVRSGLEGLEG